MKEKKKYETKSYLLSADTQALKFFRTPARHFNEFLRAFPKLRTDIGYIHADISEMLSTSGWQYRTPRVKNVKITSFDTKREAGS
jgi:hypothetical protein